jgi:dGTP triphosphohydrolase
MAKKAVDYYEDIFKSLKKADGIYKSLNDDITSIVKRPGVLSSRAFSAKEKLDELAKTSPETIFAKIASENDIEKAKWLMKNYGEEYKQMVSQKLGKVWLEVAQTRKDVRDVVLREFKNLTDSQKIALLGEKANEKITNVADIVNKAADKMELGNFLDSIYKKVGPSEEFGAAVVNRLKTKSKDELLAIFGPDHVNKIKAIVDIGSFKRSMANPSKTAQNLELFKPSTWLEPLKEIKAEASRINKYKELVVEPAKAGDKMIKTGKRLAAPKTFGATEAARSALITPNREEQ